MKEFENSGEMIRFSLRLPRPMIEKLQDRATRGWRSLNAQIIVCLEEYFMYEESSKLPYDRLLDEVVKRISNSERLTPISARETSLDGANKETIYPEYGGDKTRNDRPKKTK